MGCGGAVSGDARSRALSLNQSREACAAWLSRSRSRSTSRAVHDLGCLRPPVAARRSLRLSSPRACGRVCVAPLVTRSGGVPSRVGRWSLRLEDRWPASEEGGHAFFLIVGLEAAREALDLERVRI